MTAHPLDFTFPAMSAPVARDGAEAVPLSARAPHTVPLDEIALGLEAEHDRRRQQYPRLVERRRLAAEEAERHQAILRQIIDDLTPLPADIPPLAHARRAEEQRARRSASAFRWADKVRELRRDLAIRRNTWPRRIAEGRAFTRDDRAIIEALEAAHWRYWIRLDHWDAGDAADPAPTDPRAAIRRQAAAVEAWLVQAHHAADPALAGYEPALVAWLVDQANQKEAA